MRWRRPLGVALIVFVVGLSDCTSTPSPVTPSVVAASATPVAVATCPDLVSISTLPAASVAPDPVPSRPPLPSTPPPGRMVFRDGDRKDVVQVYEGGRVREWALGAAPLSSVRLSADGQRVAALVGDPTPQSIWTLSIASGATAQRPIALPAAASQEFDLSFSPDLSWLFYVPSLATAESELFLVDTATGHASRALIPGGWVHGARWRSNNELVFVTGPMPQNASVPRSYPGRFFRWHGGSDPVEIGQAEFSGALAVSPTSDVVFAALENGAPLIRALGLSEPLVSPGALFGSREGCALQYRTDVRVQAPTWSADGSHFAIVGNGNNLTAGFVAMRTSGAGPVGVFRAPYSCYIMQSAWSGPRYIVNLTGPDCGRTTLEGRLVVLDAEARVVAEYPDERKAFFVPSADGAWVASATTGGWQFIHLDPPNERIVVPLGGPLEGWCCP